MKRQAISLTALCLLPFAPAGASYSDSMQRLEVSNPEFVFHVDLEGDFATAGAFLTEAYMAYLMTGPQVPPVPVDATALFNRLGLNNLTAFSAVSEAREKGGFRNQMLYRFAGTPKGLFLLTGEVNRPFSVQESAPTDADLAAEFTFNGIALYQIAREILVDVMGPMGQGMIETQLNQPVVPDGPTYADLLNRLSTRAQIVARPEVAPSGGPLAAVPLLNGRAAIRFANVADLLETVAPLLELAGFARSGDALWEASFPAGESSLSLFLEPLSGSNDLLLSLNEASREWYRTGNSATLADSPEFKKAIAGLPESGLSFWYSSERLSRIQLQSLESQLGTDPKFLPVIRIFQDFLGRFTGSQSGLSRLEPDAYRVVSLQPASYKTNIALAGAFIPLGFLNLLAPGNESDGAALPGADGDPDPSPAN